MGEKLDEFNDDAIIKMQKEVNAEIKSLIDSDNRIKAMVDPIVKQNLAITNLVKPSPIASLLPSFNIADRIGASYISAFDTAALLGVKYVNPLSKYFDQLQSTYAIINKINSWSIPLAQYSGVAISKVYDSLAGLRTVISSPAMQWLSGIDFTPMQSILTKINLDTEYWDKYEELNQAYLNAMYECKWFPYAGWTVDYELFTEVTEILSTSRHGSSRREKRIDKAIFSYYTQKEIKNIKRSWKKSDVEPHIKKILGQAIEAHLRGEYVLTTTCLSSMWEGLIHYKLHITGRSGQRKTFEGFKELIDENNFEDVYSEFYEKLILSQCDEPKDVIEGVPNRNGISHSKYKKYPNKKASLNAILITDFIISLKPKEISAE